MSYAERIAIIRDFVPRLRAQIADLTDEQLTTQYNVPEWTIAQNVHHLVDSHVHAYLIFKIFLTTDGERMPLYDSHVFANMPDGCDANINDSLLILEGLHARWTRLLDSIDDWDKTGFHPAIKEQTDLAMLLNIYSNHCNGHIQQIQDVLDKM